MKLMPLFMSLMFLSSLFVISIVSTNSSSDPVPLDTEQVSFTNVTYQAGLQNVGGQFLAWGDYNNDGYQDLLINGNRLFENNGPPNWDFTEVTSQVGISGGSYGTWADWNNDGYLDFFVAGSDKLYKNNGPPNWNFSDVSAVSGIPQETYSTGCGWGDYDNDGFVDLYKLRGENYDEGIYYPDRLYHNNGNGTFTDVTEEAGVSEEADPKYGRGCAWADYNDDGWQDIYISNYRRQFNYLYENQGDGTFIDVAPEKGVHDGPPYGEGGNLDPYNRAGHGVGSVWGDYDNDGYLDLWVTNLNHKDARTSDDSLLYHSDGPPDYTFTNMRDTSEIPVKPYVFPNEGDELFVGCAWGDYDNDGDLDLYLPQIYDISYAYSFLYSNDGDGTFTDVTAEAGVRVWDTYAGCWCDYDNDGDLDLITSGRDSGGNGAPHFVHLFRNEGNSNKWLHLDITGNGENTNKAGIGARVEVITWGVGTQIKEVEGGMGPHGMQNSLILEFGLGDYSGVVDIKINWTNGTVQYLHDIDLNQSLTITEAVPDLEVKDVYASDEKPYQGKVIQLNAAIRNVGEISTKTAQVKFYLGDPSSGIMIEEPTVLGEMYPGWTRFAQISWDTSGYYGSKTIYATVEKTSPSEDILGNNFLSTEIFIREENDPPVSSLSLSPYNPEVGEDVTFDGSNSTDDSKVQEYLFDFGDGQSSGWTLLPTVKHSYHKSGLYTVSLRVRDNDGAENTNLEEQDLRIRGPPMANLAATPTSTNVGKPVTFNGSASKDDGKVTAYLFDFGDGQDSGWIANPITAHAYSLGGQYIASLKVRDDEGRTSTNDAKVQINVLVLPNTKPVAYIDTFPDSAIYGDEVSFSGHGSDEDGQVVAYQWSSSIDGELSTNPSFSTSSLNLGEHTISFKVQDDDGEWSLEVSQILTVKLVNEKPTVSIETPEDYQEVSGVLIIKGSAQDADGTIERVDIRIDGGSWETASGTTDWSYELDTNTLADGEHVVTARAFDGEDFSEENSISIVVNQEKSGDEEGLNPLLIMGIVLIVVVIVIALAAVGLSSKKKEGYQPPQEAQSAPETYDTRFNW